MNYAKSMLMPLFVNSNFSFGLGAQVDKEVKFLIEDGRKAIAEAKEENKYGDIANDLTQTEGEPDASERHDLTVIAVWHYERGIEKYREAVKYLKIAAAHDLPEKYEKYITLQIKEAEKQLNIILEQKNSIKDLQEEVLAA